MQALHEGTGAHDAAALHKTAMEGGLIGTDISPIAAHLTSASLAAIGTGERYGKTQIGWVKVGGPTSAIGSLEYFKNDEIGDLWDRPAGISTGTDESEETEMSVFIPDESVDWILMNPPYSRTNGKHGAFEIAGLSDDERDACQKKWGRTIRNEPAKKEAGMAASFLALARNKVKSGGRIGFVLPLTAAFGNSWAVTREMIEHEFTDIIAITTAAGKALGKKALSADTKMEEMILVATRREGSGEYAPIRCITFYAPVTMHGEAGETARAILDAVDKAGGAGSSQPIIIGETEIGQVCVFDAGGKGAPWGPLGATHADLAFATDALIHGRLEFLGKSMELNAGMVTLGDVFDVGPSESQIGHPRGGDGRGAFEFNLITDSAGAIGTDMSLWGANGTTQVSLVVEPTHKGKAVASKERCEKMRSQRSRLFYASGMRWNSQALLAATTKHKAMGGRAWLALMHDDIRVCKAFALWVNSTLGMMAHWTQGQRTHAGRSTMRNRAIKQVPCPRLDKIGADMLDSAAAEFDRLTSLRLRPAYHAHLDEARWEIDLAVVKMLGLPEDAIEVIDALRPLWCREPSIRGDKPFVSLKKWKAEQS